AFCAKRTSPSSARARGNAAPTRRSRKRPRASWRCTAPALPTGWWCASMSSARQPYPGYCYAQRKRPWRRRATYVRRGGVGYFFGAYDVHADVLFGGYRLAKSTTEVLAFYQYIRRRYPDHVRVYLVNDNLSLHWTPQIRVWAESHNVELVPTPTSASHLNRIECHFRPLRGFVI